MQVNLNPDTQQRIQAFVASGYFESADDFINTAVAMYRQPGISDNESTWMKAEILKGIESAKRGDGTTIHNAKELDAFFEGIRARGMQRLAKEHHPTQE